MYQFTPAFHAVGFLTGPNAAFSWLGGAILSYAIIGPSLVATGKAYSPLIEAEDYPDLGYHNNFSLGTVNYKPVKGGPTVTDASRGTAR